jgi:hypothetical protein
MMALLIFGASAGTISGQCREHGLIATKMDFAIADRLNDAINLASIHGVLSEKETDRARRRLMKAMGLKQGAYDGTR